MSTHTLEVEKFTGLAELDGAVIGAPLGPRNFVNTLPETPCRSNFSFFDVWLRTGTTCDARFHQSILRSNSSWRNRDARRTRCAPRGDGLRTFCYRPLTPRACPMARHIRHRYRAHAEDGRALH